VIASELIAEFITELVADLIAEADLVGLIVMKVSVGPVVHTLERPSTEFVGRTEHLGKEDECRICCMTCRRDNHRSDHRSENRG
jgi:hypothetical protein